MSMPYQEVIKGKWQEFAGKAKETWGKLTDNHLLEVKGNVEKFEGILRQEYGYTEEEARRKISDFMKDFGEKTDQQVH